MTDTALADLDSLAEDRFGDCLEHWETCKQCHDAGGELALLEKMCPKGQQLTIRWEKVERNYLGSVLHEEPGSSENEEAETSD